LHYFLLIKRTVATAIATIMAMTLIVKYITMSELETTGCVPEVGAGVGDAADATVAEVTPCEVKYESVPLNVA